MNSLLVIFPNTCKAALLLQNYVQHHHAGIPSQARSPCMSKSSVTFVLMAAEHPAVRSAGPKTSPEDLKPPELDQQHGLKGGSPNESIHAAGSFSNSSSFSDCGSRPSHFSATPQLLNSRQCHAKRSVGTHVSVNGRGGLKDIAQGTCASESLKAADEAFQEATDEALQEHKTVAGNTRPHAPLQKGFSICEKDNYAVDSSNLTTLQKVKTSGSIPQCR